MAIATNNTNNTYTGTENANLLLKAVIGGTWNLLGSTSDVLANGIRRHDLGQALDDTTWADLALQRGRFIEEMNAAAKDKIEKLVSSMTYSNGKLTKEDIDLADATVAAMAHLGEKDKVKALKEIKIAIWNAKRVAATSGDKAAKDALKSEVQRAVDSALEAWAKAQTPVV